MLRHSLTAVLVVGLLAFWAHEPEDVVSQTISVSEVSVDAVTRATETVQVRKPVEVKFAPQVFDISKEMASLKVPTERFSQYYGTEPESEEDRLLVLAMMEEHYGLPKNLLKYQNHVESKGRCYGPPSAKGARGCFQFMPRTARDFGLIGDGFDNTSNFFASADAAVRYMKWVGLVLYGESLKLDDWDQLRHVLAAYNAGHAVVKRAGEPRIPNFYETVNYVNKIEDLVKGRAVIVEWGDSLDKISARTGVSENSIVRGNPILASKGLLAGSVLSLPDENGMTKVVVKRGMSLFYLQSKTGVSVEDMVLANNLSNPGVIRTADVLFIPVESGSL